MLSLRPYGRTRLLVAGLLGVLACSLEFHQLVTLQKASPQVGAVVWDAGQDEMLMFPHGKYAQPLAACLAGGETPLHCEKRVKENSYGP